MTIVNSKAACLVAATLGMSPAFGYSTTATVTFTFGGNSNSASLAPSAWSPNADTVWAGGR